MFRRTKTKSRILTCFVAGSLATAAAASNVAVPGVSWSACVGTAIDGSTLTLPAAALAVGAPAAWAAGYQGNGVDVAVIDTGVNAVPGLASAGKVVDAVDLSFDAVSTSVRYRDAYGHGTNMAGIIAGDGSGGALTTGVAPKARIVNVKVGAGDGSVDASQVIAALDWVVQNRNVNGRNIRVVNLSYDTDAATDYRSDPLSHAVENAWKAGIVVVVSGGNDGKGTHALGNPARNPFVIAVGASSWDPTRFTFKIPNWSSTGDGVRNPDVVAPGDQIASLRVPGSYLDTTYPAARVYEPLTCTGLFRGSGTSQAAAVTAGAAALLIQQRPTLTPDQVKALLTSTALPMNMPVEQQGSGMINVAAALKAATTNKTQSFSASSGTGYLENARGTVHVGTSSTDLLTGEYQAFMSTFSARNWATASNARTAWTNQTYDALGRLATGTWSGSSWSGSSWSGSSWSGSSWSGSSWSGSSWSGSSWSGSSWSGSSWSGSSWSGSSWSGYGWR
jgi:serine protease AprX